jgi:hypothetical protein
MADMQTSALRSLRGPSLSTTWGLLAWLLVPVMAIASLGPVSEADVYWHIRMGADILANGRLGGDRDWTYGAAAPDWVTTQAAAEVLLFAIHDLWSWAGIMLFRVAMAVAATTSLLFACTTVVRTRPRLPVDRSVALVALVVSGVMVAFIQERPQSLSLILLPWVGVVLLQVMYADRWPKWWAVGLVVMVWSWFHGAGVMVGPLLLAAALAHALGTAGLRWLPELVRSLRKGWLVVAVALVAPGIGPPGLSYYSQAARIQEAANGRLIEWSPPDANSAYVWLALLLVGTWAFALVRLAARSGRVWRTFRMDTLAVVALILVMTSAGRYLGVGVLLLAPLVVRRLAQAWTRPGVGIERMRPRVAAVIVGVLSVVAVALGGLVASQVRPVARHHPLLVWEGLREQPDERRVLVDYALGGQAGLLGEVAVSTDGRADRYGGAAIDANRAFVAGRPGWEETLADYPGTTDVVVQSDGAIVQLLQTEGWSVVCVDGSYTWLTAPGVTGGCPETAAD